MKQRTEKWFSDKAAHVSASRFKDVMAFSQKTGKPLKAREDYLIEIVTERLTGESIASSHGAAGRWGTEVEEYAGLAYEAETGFICKESEFIRHPKIKYVGCSPDGLINSDGGMEIKCPVNSSNHLKTIIADLMPDEHIPQVQGCMWVTDRKWWDFVSYDPRMPPHLQLFIKRIERDDKYIQMLEEETNKFLDEVSTFIKKLPKAA